MKIYRQMIRWIMVSIVLTGCGLAKEEVAIPNIQQQVEKEPTQSTAPIAPKETAVPQIIEVDWGNYFGEHKGSAVFYNPSDKVYQVYNLEGAKEQRSPCSTFKIVSTLAALEYGVVTKEDSLREWSQEPFWNSDWNKDIELEDAFKTSCVWYYRQIIDEIGPDQMQYFVDGLDYGNKDLSDWEGRLNQNNSNRKLTGFWIESSLKISPFEQVEVLERIFGDDSQYKKENIETLKELMRLSQEDTAETVYGKTGYGRLKDKTLDAWFVGMFEQNTEPYYFAVHLAETKDLGVTSTLAKSITLQIIEDTYK